jgi:hypothetical protein
VNYQPFDLANSRIPRTFAPAVRLKHQTVKRSGLRLRPAARGMGFLVADRGGSNMIEAVMLLAMLLLLVYFVPTMVAHGRNHRQRLAITVLNTVLGWTLIGWAGALVWACTTDVEKEQTT